MSDVSSPRRMSRRKRLMFAFVAILIPILAIGGVLLAVDVHLHAKYQKSAGFNIWGYRGPVAGKKRPGEYRIAVVGGSSAYGYGVTWDQSFPALLEQRLAAAAPVGRSFRVLNLGYNNEGAYSFTFTLRDYAYLHYDLVCMYEGYNDLLANPQLPNLSVFRHDSPVFRLTGYLPIFPIVFNEKAASMLAGGDVGALYRSEPKTVFSPGVATQAAAGVLRTTAEIGQSLERQLGRATPEPPRHLEADDATGCKYPWGMYCRAVSDAVTLALSANRQVLFVTQPFAVGDTARTKHREQQREVAAMLERTFGRDPRVRYLNLGGAIDLSDPTLSFDRMHLTPAGNQQLSEQLVAPVVEMASRRDGPAGPGGTHP
jgi:hypothetical protein